MSPKSSKACIGFGFHLVDAVRQSGSRARLPAPACKDAVQQTTQETRLDQGDLST
jgi:hypothetical protein